MLVSKAMAPYGYEQLGLVIPHQVNLRIIEAAADRLERALAADKVAVVHVRTDPKATRQSGANYLA